MNFLSFLGRPAPVWLSLLRLALMCGLLISMSYDGNFKPVADEIVVAVKEFRRVMETVEAEQKLKQPATTPSIEPNN